jgi:hypothetical protein
MATGSSIVGTWNAFVDWGATGNPIFASVSTFDADGTWAYSSVAGAGSQMEDMTFSISTMRRVSSTRPVSQSTPCAASWATPRYRRILDRASGGRPVHGRHN